MIANNDNNNNNKNSGSLTEAENIRNQLNALPIQDNDTNHAQEVKKSNNQYAAKGFAASMNIVSGVMVGGFMGYGFDYLFHTLPFGTVIMIPIGMIAGFRNMIRSLESDTNKKND
jgi:ATP synthase protein I